MKYDSENLRFTAALCVISLQNKGMVGGPSLCVNHFIWITSYMVSLLTLFKDTSYLHGWPLGENSTPENFKKPLPSYISLENLINGSFR